MTARTRQGFFFTLEAACALLLLLIAASLLPAFSIQRGNDETAILCSDAARVIAKSHNSGIPSILKEESRLSGLCLSLDYGGETTGTCTGTAKFGETTAFTFPILSSGALQKATLFCWKAG